MARRGDPRGPSNAHVRVHVGGALVPRIVVAAAVLCVTLRLVGFRFPPWGRIWLHFLALAIIGNVLPFYLISWGQQTVPSGVAGILMGTNPLVTLVLAHFLVRGEPMTLLRAAGFAVGFVGVLMLMGPEALAAIGGDLLRQGGILAGALCYATNTILTRRMPQTHPLVASACVLLVASPVIVPAAILAPGPATEATAASLLAVLWLGLVPTAAATVLYFRVVRGTTWHKAPPTCTRTCAFEGPLGSPRRAIQPSSREKTAHDLRVGELQWTPENGENVTNRTVNAPLKTGQNEEIGNAAVRAASGERAARARLPITVIDRQSLGEALAGTVHLLARFGVRAPPAAVGCRAPGAERRGSHRRGRTNSHVVQPRLTKSREFSGRPTRGNSRIEGTRPVRSGLPPPPSSLANLYKEETRAGFPYGFRGFAGVGATRDAHDGRNAPHYRSRSRLPISGGSGCADGFPLGVPFTLQWPPMAVWAAGRRRGQVFSLVSGALPESGFCTFFETLSPSD